MQISGNISPYEALKHLDPDCDEIMKLAILRMNAVI